MKKALFCGIAAALILVACDNKPNTPEEVLEASIEAVEQANSYKSDITIEQKIKILSTTDTQTTTLTMDYVKEPKGFHVTQDTIFSTEEKPDVVNSRVKAQLYYADGDTYSTDTIFDDWYKGKETGFHPSVEEASEFMNLSKRLKDLEKHADKLELKEKEDHYLITLSGSGDSFYDLSVFFFDLSMPAMEKTKWNENPKNNGFTYTIHIDKDNFHLTKSLIEADLKMDIWEETEDLITKTVIEEDITQYDEKESIVIPDEVLENALDNKTGEKAN